MSSAKHPWRGISAHVVLTIFLSVFSGIVLADHEPGLIYTYNSGKYSSLAGVRNRIAQLYPAHADYIQVQEKDATFTSSYAGQWIFKFVVEPREETEGTTYYSASTSCLIDQCASVQSAINRFVQEKEEAGQCIVRLRRARQPHEQGLAGERHLAARELRP